MSENTEHDLHQREQARARSVQMGMLPTTPVLSGYDIASSYQPCDNLAGDFYDFIVIDRWRLGIVFADVSGHGTAAALLMAAAKKVFQFCGKGVLSPKQTVLEVNDSIRVDIPRGMFLSVLYSVLDVRTGKLCFVSCGHQPPVLQRGDRQKSRWSHENGPVLGVMSSDDLDPLLHEEFVQLANDDLLFFYTDGITEVFNPDEQMLGDEAVLARVADSANASADELLQSIQAQVDQHRANAEQTDDETMLAVRLLDLDDAEPLTPDDEQTSSEQSLPQFEEPLIGREHEIAKLVNLLADDKNRVIWVSGPAGVGKSRVCLQGAHAAKDLFQSGLYVDLKTAETRSDVVHQVASAMGLQTNASDMDAQITRSMDASARRRVLVLDNCDACRTDVQACVADWTAKSAHITILVACQFSADSNAITNVRIRPLAFPTNSEVTPEEALTYPSIELFCLHAKRSDPKFELDDSNCQSVAKICDKLDGLPQAIELAAARVGVMSTRQILDRLDQRLDLLQGDGTSTGGALRGALSSSWNLLEYEEQEALMRLSFFPDGFQLDTASALLQDIEGKNPEALVQSLLRHNLLHSTKPKQLDGDRRFFVYQSIKHFAQDLLFNTSRYDEVQTLFEQAAIDVHKRYWREYTYKQSLLDRRRLLIELEVLQHVHALTTNPERRAWATIMGARHLHSRGQRDLASQMVRASFEGLYPGSDEWMWLHLIDAGIRVQSSPEDVFEMLERIDGDDMIQATTIYIRSTALHLMGKTTEAIEGLMDALKIPSLAPLTRANFQQNLANYQASIGQIDEARTNFSSVMRVLEREGRVDTSAAFLHAYAWFLLKQGDFEKAEKCARLAAKSAQIESEHNVETIALGTLALSLSALGRKQEAGACMQRAIRVARNTGDMSSESVHMNTMGRIYYDQQKFKEAIEYIEKSRDLARQIGNKKTEAIADGNVAALKMEMGDLTGVQESLENSHRLLLELNDYRSAQSVRANIGSYLGKQWERTGQRRYLNEAIKNLRQASEERRASGYEPLADSEISLAKLLAESGKKKDAVRVIEAAIEVLKSKKTEIGERHLQEAQEIFEGLTSRPNVLSRGRKPISGKHSITSKRSRDSNRTHRALPKPLPSGGNTPPPKTIQAPPAATGNSPRVRPISTPRAKPIGKLPSKRKRRPGLPTKPLPRPRKPKP